MYYISVSENPAYLDAMDEYRRLRKTYSVVDTIQRIQEEEMTDQLTDQDDAPFVWLGLAKAQIFRKELLPEVASHAGLSIKSVSEYNEYGLRYSPTQLNRISEQLQDDRYYIDPDSARIVPKPHKQREFRCKWAVGDTFAMQIHTENPDYTDLEGKYIVFRKAGENKLDQFGAPRTCPVVYVTVCDDPKKIKTSDDLSNLGLIMICGRKKEHGDTRGRYGLELSIRSNRQLERAGFEFIGNFSDAMYPSNEMYGGMNVQTKEYFVIDCVRLPDFTETVCRYYCWNGIVHPPLQRERNI